MALRRFAAPVFGATGSKRDKVEKLGVAILTEEQARALLD